MEAAHVGVKLVVMMEEVVSVSGVRMLMLLHADISQVPVLPDELIHPPVQLLDAGALRLDETLLVLHNCGELPQVQDRLHRIFQQAGAHPTREARTMARKREAKRTRRRGRMYRDELSLRCCCCFFVSLKDVATVLASCSLPPVSLSHCAERC